MRASAIIVHFHAPALAAKAVRSFHDDARSEGLSLEVLVVDNGSTPAERQELASLDVGLVEPGANRGYAAGINAGVAASTGDLLLLANADIEVMPGCLAALRHALGAGLAVVGPRFFLDAGCTWLQPPADRRTLAAELATVCARAGVATRSVRRAWRRRAHTFWSADQPIAMRQLSGALLALRRDVWEAVGGFDEAYRLYFEETDWLMRLAASGRRAGLVPQAHAVHLWGQSTRLEPRAATWFEESARRFRRRWYGALGARVLESVSSGLRYRRSLLRPEMAGTGETSSSTAWLELASDPVGFPAAGHPPADVSFPRLTPPPSHLPRGVYRMRGVSADARDLWIADPM